MANSINRPLSRRGRKSITANGPKHRGRTWTPAQLDARKNFQQNVSRRKNG
ncbi:hypothetical protein [Flavihumibacter petaseus]|uniref:hypothetical protein n=1 Tax=Flavihumibacter petaseus TaxID=549295 RepID=UPI000AF92340|nr:hypothetical protein [Flavihumibacter petaseus]